MAKVGKIKIDALASTVMKELDNYAYIAGETVNKAVKEAADEVADVVAAKAPVRTGEYKSQIDSGEGSARGKGRYSAKVFVNGGKYRIAHLLEHGHAKGGWAVGYRKGNKGHASRKGGRVPPSPPDGHWKPAADVAPEILVQKIKEGLD